MATEDAGGPPVDGSDEKEPTGSETEVTVGRYSWRDFLHEHGHADAVEALYAEIDDVPAVPADAVRAHVETNGNDVDVVRIDDVDGTSGPVDANEVDADDVDADAIVDVDEVLVSAAAVMEDVEDGAEDAGEDGAEDPGEDDGEDGEEAFDDGSVVVAGRDVGLQPARTPTADDWERAGIDPAAFLGFDPSDLDRRLWAADAVGEALWDLCHARYNLYELPVLKGYYTWVDYRDEFFLDEEGNPPTDENDEPLEFTHEDKTDALGFDPNLMEDGLAAGADAARAISELVDERTVNVNSEIDEDAFFSTADGHTTLTNRYDLEKAVPMAKKTHFREEERYWVNKPYAFVVVFHSTKENERKYYAIQPYLTRIESDLQEFLTAKLRTSIKYADESIVGGDEAFREGVIVDEARALLARYDLYADEGGGGMANELAERFGGFDELAKRLEGVDRFAGRLGGVDDLARRLDVDATRDLVGRITGALGYEPPTETPSGLSGISARPEPALLAEDQETLSEYQVEKLLYYLKRDFIGYERIDPIKYDINVEDISCDGYDSPVFVYHSEYEQVITNVYHGTDELDDFVVKLAQRSGKGISKRRPQVDATLVDGSRAQLTLGREVSDHGTNYTIRQFNDIPFTPVDLINWRTFSLDQMSFLWLCIENHKSLIFAGGTASGKTTSLNAVSLFIPSNAKIVSIEDTREVELPQRNWIASVTRPSFSDDDKGDIDEFDLLEAALRQRPDYIVMGEIRGEEGRTLFQVMSTGHTTYTTFHADSVGEVLKRFTTDPINVSKTMFTALDLVSVQTSTRVKGRKVRRNKSLTEINHYDSENDEINVQDVYQWQAETDEFLEMGDSNTLEEILFDRGWSRAKLDDELRKRRIVLAYLIDRGLDTYAEVAATFQAFINDPETILALMANDELERSLEDLREMESVHINVDHEKEALVPRPEPDEEGRKEAISILESAEELFAEYRGQMPDSVADALLDVDPAVNVEAHPNDDHGTLTGTALEAVDLDPEAAGSGFVDVAEPGDADDRDDAMGTIDFDVPFDDGIDVMNPSSIDDLGPFGGESGENGATSGEDQRGENGEMEENDEGIEEGHENDEGIEEGHENDEDGGIDEWAFGSQRNDREEE